MSEAESPRLYGELAPWFHLLTAPAEYAEEAAAYRDLLVEASPTPPQTLLELGSGGGNNASHYKHHFTSTLVDPSPEMLEQSRGLNPECEHLLGDMRTVRLGRTFDAVFVHDAVMYLTTRDDLSRAVATAFLHCRPGGVALFVPDCVRETFRPGTSHGGHDGDRRALRYLEWTTDPDPDDDTFRSDFAIVLAEDGQPTRVVHDLHRCGVFPRADWLRILEGAGFRPAVRSLTFEGETVEAFVAVRPAE